MRFTSRQRGWIAGFVAAPVAAVALAACVPTSASGPGQAAVSAAVPTTTVNRGYWGSNGDDSAGAVGNKVHVTTTIPPAITCNWSNLEIALEQCLLTYKSFGIDTANTWAQARATAIAAVITPNQCLSNLDAFHSDRPGQPSLPQQYPGMSPLGENLYCYFPGGGNCPSGNLGATHARDAWIGSPSHKSTMDSFPVVNGGAACFPTSSFDMARPGGVYVAVAQFHF